MRIYKIISLLVLAGLLWSCGGGVSQEEYDEIYNEYKQMKESLDATQQSNLNQAATINKTLSELAEISGNTMILRGNVENGTAQLRQAEKINNNIKAIKSKIASLEKQVGNDETYKKMVANLRTIVKEKEIEIKYLKGIIQSQNSTITVQQTTISQQQEEINQKGQQLNKQQEQLKTAIKIQATLIYQAASEFEKFAEDVPDVSKKKNQKKVNDWAISMLKRSLLYYEKAQEYGIDASSDISRVKRLITSLK